MLREVHIIRTPNREFELLLLSKLGSSQRKDPIMQDRKVIVAASEAASLINAISNEFIKNVLMQDLREGNFQRVQQELGVCVVPDSEIMKLKRSVQKRSLRQTFLIATLVVVLGSIAVMVVPVIWIPFVMALWLTSIFVLKRLC